MIFDFFEIQVSEQKIVINYLLRHRWSGDYCKVSDATVSRLFEADSRASGQFSRLQMAVV